MKKPSKTFFLATTLCITYSLINVSIAQEAQSTLVNMKEVPSSQLLKKQRQNKPLALSTVKRGTDVSLQATKQSKSQYLIHSALPSHRFSAKNFLGEYSSIRLILYLKPFFSFIIFFTLSHTQKWYSTNQIFIPYMDPLRLQDTVLI